MTNEPLDRTLLSPHSGGGLWLVLVAHASSVAAETALFWSEASALAFAEHLVLARLSGASPPSIGDSAIDIYNASVDPSDRVVIRQVEIRGERERCSICGEPIVLDDPADPMSWIHAEDADDMGDHTAER